MSSYPASGRSAADSCGGSSMRGPPSRWPMSTRRSSLGSRRRSPTGYHEERAYAAVQRVFDTTAVVLETADAEGITTAEAADRRVERRMAEMARVQQIRTYR